MTKTEFEATVMAAAGDSEYGKEIVKDLVDHFDETGKYAQTAKDRLDERIATLEGWAKKHAAEGDLKKADEENEKAELAKKVLAAIA